MSLEHSALSGLMDKFISKSDALTALGQATGMSDMQLLDQMPGLKGQGTVNLTANHTLAETGSIPTPNKIRVQISSSEEYLLILGDTPTIVPYETGEQDFSNH